MTEVTTIKSYATRTGGGKYVVGGIELDRPFKVRRLGHFGLNFINYREAVRFYTDLLGFDISDVRNYAERLKPDQAAELKRRGGEPVGCFARYGLDHHAMVLFNRHYREIADPPGRWPQGVTINQITWQVGSLGEVGDAIKYFKQQNVPVLRSGRDMPGSNWHTYLHDPDGNTNELYWGIEQVGWDGYSKPKSLYHRAFQVAPELPQISEFSEVQEALDKGMKITDGYRHAKKPPAKFDVQGILLPRPFKVVRMGPVRLFAKDIEASAAFYVHHLGFLPIEETEYKGHRCIFLRCATEHTAVALYPLALRAELKLSEHSNCLSIGMQVANYKQLRDARAFLKDQGVPIKELPPELSPGIDYSFLAIDPDGHAVQFYYYMEQIGLENQPRPANQRRKVTPGEWPETIEPLSDTFMGEPFLGPWG